MPYILKLWLNEVPEWTSLFCCLQLIVTVISQMASSSATAIYAEGNIKWYAIYKSTMNLLPIITTYVAFTIGAAPYWLYIAMVTIWGIGGDLVIVYFTNKQCGLAIQSFARGIIVPTVTTTMTMLIIGFTPQLFLEPGITRFILTITITTITFGAVVWSGILTTEERGILIHILNHRFKKSQ